MDTAKTPAWKNTISALVHEIRNPLTAIKLAGELLQQGEKEELKKDDIERLAAIISKNIQKIETHLRDVLLASPDEPVVFAPVDAGQVIDLVLNKVEDRLALGGITVCKDYRPVSPVIANAEKLSIAFLNIIINAIEAMEAGGKLWISLDGDGDTTKVIFRDNGIGMDRPTLDRLFEPNFTSKPDGFGIGMSSVKRILDLHDAPVTIDSEPGKGTMITILFRNN